MRTIREQIDDMDKALKPMSEQQRITLRRLATDLKPFIEALERSTDDGEGNVWLSAARAAEACRAFTNEVWAMAAKRK